MAQQKSGKRRYAIYLRCSSDDQSQGDFTTIDTQREINTAFVAQHDGILVKEYADEGKTGTNLNRPGWKALIRQAEEGLFDTVVVTYMSRLGRGDAFTVAEWTLRDANVSVEMVKEQFTDDLSGYIGKQMTRFMDGMYPRMVSLWTRTKQEQMVAHGYVCGPQVAFGYRKEAVQDAGVSRHEKRPPQRFVPDPLSAPLLKHAFEVFVETHSYNRVVEYLRSVTPRKWTLNNITYMLRNDVYRGVLRYGQNVNYTAHEPIISEALWDAARSAEKTRCRSPKQNPVDNTPFYLRGLVHCPHCGSRMTPASHHGRSAKVRYYECLAAHKKLTTDCPSQRVNAEALHDAILDEIALAARHPEKITAYIDQAVMALPIADDMTAELEALTGRVKEVERRMDRVQSAIEESEGELRPLTKRLNELEQERISITTERLKLESRVTESGKARPDAQHIQALWSRFAELWEGMTDEERETVMQQLVERVDIHTKTEGTCRIRISGQVPRHNVGLTYPNTPLVSVSPTNPDVLEFPLSFPRRRSSPCR